MAKYLVKKIPNEVIKNINQKLGFRLLTKFREKGVINLGKCIPLVGCLTENRITSK
ncbi:hypothetical protein QOZ83_12185 [Romboutsia sedimentorum]|uniref:hypothetical protein n=1 Tax=Romboutsia sedimentorum TaxID=1368474 RepID=UPI0024DEEF64|nr:hypothetical protein [Romboutsia sedimentorum]MDK2586621.1 hypothetical protein [Romboutsia sedimentorum]